MTGRTWLLALLVTVATGALACHTAAPRSGATRDAYPRYGVQQLELVVLAVSGPEVGSDDKMQLNRAPPPLLHREALIEPAVPQAAELSRAYASSLASDLVQAGFEVRVVKAGRTLSEQLARARERGADAVLLVRYRWVDQIILGRTLRVRVPVHQGRSDTRALTSSELEVDAPEQHAALLLLSAVQLVDAASGLLLFRGPDLDLEPGDVVRPGSSVLSWGLVAEQDEVTTLDGVEAARRAASLAVGGLRPSPWRRGVDENRARELAQLEPVESRMAWNPALVLGLGLVRFPVAVDLGPATATLDANTLRKQILVADQPVQSLALGGGFELGFRDERLLALALLRESYVPVASARTYVRTDEDTARAFRIRVGPLHDLSLDLMAGQQRLLAPWLGLRAAAGPSFHLHLIEGSVPPGTTLGDLNLALGGAAMVEPFVVLGAFELGLRLQSGVAYDLAGGVLGSGMLLLRAGLSW
ncbi:MAG: hypothetical protein ABIJ09_09670 [Pseudomonadota bacterium]